MSITKPNHCPTCIGSNFNFSLFSFKPHNFRSFWWTQLAANAEPSPEAPGYRHPNKENRPLEKREGTDGIGHLVSAESVDSGLESNVSPITFFFKWFSFVNYLGQIVFKFYAFNCMIKCFNTSHGCKRKLRLWRLQSILQWGVQSLNKC